MRETPPDLRSYLREVQAHAENVAAELDELAELSAAAPLSNRDFYAVERLLQILTEASIGVAKHWVKWLEKTAPADAYQAFELLLGAGRISAPELSVWKRVIGMRNALVHYYLNVDRQIVLAVLQQRAYRQLPEFVRRAAKAMGEAA